MKYFIVAGEASGDLHGSNLVKGILACDPGAEIYCWGGDLMEKAGTTLLMHYRKNAFMGFASVLLHLPAIMKNMRLCRKQISSINPDAVILIDYPGFNLRIAEYSKKRGFTVLYYISPKLWAWNESRVKAIKRFIDRMFIIFPFEVEFYARHGIDVNYYGNPVADEIEKFKKSAIPLLKEGSDDAAGRKRIIALVPGSRVHEVRYILPRMLEVVPFFPDHGFIITASGNIEPAVYKELTGNLPVSVEYGRTYEIVSMSEAVLVKSGTSTLEAALLGIPQVVCYRGDALSFMIARRLVKVKFISLVNLILGKEAVKELIQHRLTRENLVDSLKEILPGGSGRKRVLKDYEELTRRLGPAGASERIAAEMVLYLTEKKHNAP